MGAVFLLLGRRCIFGGNGARWKRTPSPAADTTVQYVGIFSGITGVRGLPVPFESIVLNVGVQE